MTGEILQTHMDAHRAVLDALHGASGRAWSEAAALLIETLLSGNKILVCGNGGSAADAQHFACEIVGRFLAKDRRALPVLALTTDPSVMTALSNDFGYENVFARQVEAHGAPGDLLLGITTSGRSANVVAALRAARARGMRTIGLLGENGADAAPLSTVAVTVPSSSTPRIQETHILLIHAWCDAIDRAFPSEGSQS